MKSVMSYEFFEACKTGDIEIVRQFVAKQNTIIDVETPEGWTGLVISCFNENIEIAKFLLENGANINHANKKGTTVLMYAKTPVLKNQRNTAFLAYLLENGADINAVDIFRKTILDYVIEKEGFVLADWLISKGAKRSIAYSDKK